MSREIHSQNLSLVGLIEITWPMKIGITHLSLRISIEQSASKAFKSMVWINMRITVRIKWR